MRSRSEAGVHVRNQRGTDQCDAYQTRELTPWAPWQVEAEQPVTGHVLRTLLALAFLAAAFLTAARFAAAFFAAAFLVAPDRALDAEAADVTLLRETALRFGVLPAPRDAARVRLPPAVLAAHAATRTFP